MRRAHKAADWRAVTTVVGEHWPLLMYEAFAETRSALADTPVSVVAACPAAVAVRDIFLLRWRSGDDLLLDVARGSRLDRPGPLLAVPSAELGRTINDATAIMIALRTRGEFVLARRFSDSVDELLNARITATVNPELALPSDVLHAMLQVGITRMFTGDHQGAVETLQRGYRFSPHDPRDSSASNAALKTAVAFGLVGDAAQSVKWLARSRPNADVWPPGSLRLHRMLAEGLIAIEKVDSPELERIATELEDRTPGEYIWETTVAYILAVHGFSRGDHRATLQQLEHEFARLSRWVGSDSAGGALLHTIHAELFLALGLGTRAKAVLDAAPDSPQLLAPRARLALLSGRTEEALHLAMVGLERPDVTVRERTRLTPLRAVAETRLGADAEAAESLTAAIHFAERTGARLGLVLGPRAELAAIAKGAGYAERFAALTDEISDVFPESVVAIDLTAREQEVLESLATGLTIREIAAASFLSQNTIKAQLRSLYAKLGVTSRERALIVAHRERLLEQVD